jgi:tRNA/rRNA methyltransferase
MRHLFSRQALTRDEADMLRGVCTAMLTAAQNPSRNPAPAAK